MSLLQSAENALKSVYLGVISHQINTNSDIVFSKIKQSTSDILGGEIRKLAPFKDKKGEYIQLKEELKSFYGVIEISDKAVRACQNNSKAFVNLLNSECENLVKEASTEIRDQLWNKDRIIKKELLDGTIEELSDKKMVGISEIFDITKDTIYGCKRAEVPQLNPTIKNTKDFSEMSIIEAIDDMEEKGSKIDFIVSSYTTKRRLQQKFLERGINFDSLEIQGVPLVPVKYLEDDEIYLLNTNDFTFHQLSDWNWLENEDGKVLRQVQGHPTYSATLEKYGNLICENISNQCLLKVEE